MALVTILDEDKTITDREAIGACLNGCGIEYEQWTPAHPVAVDASAEQILKTYSEEIEKLNARGGYVTADVINVSPDTPGLDEMLAKFSREHWHDEDEVRFIISGHGLFHVRPRVGPVISIEVQAGDLIRVPRGTWHWFNLCADRRIRAIRLFQDKTGWTPHYTDSGVDEGFLPVCFGLSQLPLNAP